MRALFVLALFFAAVPLHAQGSGGTQFGVGVRVTNVLVLPSFFGAAPVGGPSLLFPLSIGEGFRLEPELGYSSSDSDQIESSQLTLGVGLLPTFRRGDFTLYTGGRFRYTSSSQTFISPFDGDDAETTMTGFGIAPVVGGEHYFTRWLSLGAEAGLEYARLTTEEDDRFGGSGDEVETSSFATQGSVFIRFFFN